MAGHTFWLAICYFYNEFFKKNRQIFEKIFIFIICGKPLLYC